MADQSPTDQFFGYFQTAEASLPDLFGGWMNALSSADLQRQIGWLKEVQALSTPDKNGNIPLLTLLSGLQADGQKEQIGITAPLVLAVLGSQFGPNAAKMTATINVREDALDDTRSQSAGSATGSGSYSVLGMHVGVTVHASFSETQDHKRATDFRASIVAEMDMARNPAPEPIMRVLEAFLTLVDAEAAIAKSAITKQLNPKPTPPPK